VQTLTDRIGDKSDLNWTANATLRTLVSEPFLAECVTMAGYKKGTNAPFNYLLLLFSHSKQQILQQ